MDAAAWDQRYAGRELVWGSPPNGFVVEHATALPRGRALDLACGQGRNALWLATRGWQVVGLDFSPVAVERAAQITARSPVAVRERLTWAVADATTDPLDPTGDGYDLVVWAYLQLSSPDRETALARVPEVLRPGGLLLLVCHDATNLADGWGGPEDPAVLFDADAVVAALGAGVEVERAGRVGRVVETEDGPRTAVDTLVLARRPG
ncbi:hypothetical protein GCM10027047_34850 [Rhodococcus aerolatus]